MTSARLYSVSARSALRVALLFAVALMPPRMEAQGRDSVPDIPPGTRVRVHLIRPEPAMVGVVVVQNVDTLYVAERCEACRARPIAWVDISAIDRRLGPVLDPRGALTGAAVGGGLGGLIGAAILASSKSDQMGGGAIIIIGGAVLGCVIGGVAGLARGGEDWERLWPTVPRD